MSDLACDQCKKPHQCNVENQSGCWCFKYPSVQLLHELLDKPLQETGKCLCEDCLKRQVNLAIDEHALLFKNDEIENHGPKFVENQSLISGVDYYKENGNWVFTAWSHMKRGHCCGNGCRHCPYPKSQKK